MGKSVRWKNWVAAIDFRTCLFCKKINGTIYPIEEKVTPVPPVHNNCRCAIVIMDTIAAGRATEKGIDGADNWLAYTGILPNYYISKEEARSRGWEPFLGNLYIIAPNIMVGGGVYHNRLGKLPTAPGRIWYEADINYQFGWRNTERILFSNDGLIFVTYDHYGTFQEIIWGE